MHTHAHTRQTQVHLTVAQTNQDVHVYKFVFQVMTWIFITVKTSSLTSNLCMHIIPISEVRYLTSSVNWMPKCLCWGSILYNPVLQITDKSRGCEISRRSVSIIFWSWSKERGGYSRRKLNKRNCLLLLNSIENTSYNNACC